MEYLFLLLGAAALSYITVPVALKLAYRFKFYDQPCERKVHTGIKPHLGGLAIFAAFAVISLFMLSIDAKLLIILGGGAFYFVLGLLDDKIDLPAKAKFAAEILVTSVIVYAGMHYGFLLSNPFGFIVFSPWFMWFSIPFSVIWIVGIANAVNLIDGLDALASGVILIACIVLSIAALMNPAISLSPLLIILIGSLIGYIKYNLYPSKIIMGDSGSLFLGYTIAIISLSSFTSSDRSIFLALIPPAMALFVPISDTLMAIYRRRINGKRIFAADKNHFHHCLMHRGYSHPSAVKIVWALSASFGVVSVVLSELIFQQVYLALALMALVIVWAVYSAGQFGLFAKPGELESESLQQAAVTQDPMREAK